jgi:hypothetical protein
MTRRKRAAKTANAEFLALRARIARYTQVSARATLARAAKLSA